MELSCQALFLDLSGVIWEGDTLLDGAVEAVKAARSRDLALRFVTNTATRGTDEILARLARFGIPAKREDLFTAPLAAHRYIEENGLRPFCLIHEAIRPEFADLEGNDPDCVLLGDARDDLTYEALNRAFRLCVDGAVLIGLGMNRCFQGDEGLQLDAGPFIHAIEWAAGTEAVIMGKPSRAFFEQVVASTGYDAGDCLMVGDDVEGDVVGAVESGLKGALVRTGKFCEGDEEHLPEGAHLIDSIAELFS